MIAKIIGIEPVNYVSKKTGKEVNGITLYFTYNSGNVWGDKCGDVYVGCDKPDFEQFKPYVDEPKKLLGLTAELDRNDRGYVETLKLLDKPKTA